MYNHVQINFSSSWSCKWNSCAATFVNFVAPFWHKFFSSWSNSYVMVKLLTDRKLVSGPIDNCGR